MGYSCGGLHARDIIFVELAVVGLGVSIYPRVYRVGVVRLAFICFRGEVGTRRATGTQAGTIMGDKYHLDDSVQLADYVRRAS